MGLELGEENAKSESIIAIGENMVSGVQWAKDTYSTVL